MSAAKRVLARVALDVNIILAALYMSLDILYTEYTHGGIRMTLTSTRL
jgi:hypothetical protein